MTTTTKQKNWALQNKETGDLYSNWTYPTRDAARKAAKGRRFKGTYKVVKLGDGGIDPKKLKKPKKVVPKTIKGKTMNKAPKHNVKFTETKTSRTVSRNLGVPFHKAPLFGSRS